MNGMRACWLYRIITVGVGALVGGANGVQGLYACKLVSLKLQNVEHVYCICTNWNVISSFSYLKNRYFGCS